DSCLREGDNLNAIKIYKKILKKNEAANVPPRIYYQIGIAHQQGNRYAEALEYFDKAIKVNFINPEVYFNYGLMKIGLGKYSDAISAFEMYKESDGENIVKADKLIASCKFAIKMSKEIQTHEIHNEKELNSESSDYGLGMAKNKLLFSSTRIEKNDAKLDNYTGQGFSDFYESENKNGHWSKPVKITGDINTKFNEGSIVFNNSMQAYYMQCNGEKGKKDLCNILKAEYDSKQNKWINPVPLKINSQGYSIGHPALSTDAKTLYFVSDMPGGAGGKDIWKSLFKNGEWTTPINITEINTDGNEMFPYVLEDSLLYFSSDGLIGMGGLDLFKIKLNENEPVGKPINMGIPFNSNADDFSIVFTSSETGLFCSNREGGVGDDDIYSFSLLPVVLSVSGNITDKATLKNISGVLITVKGNDGSVLTAESDSKGHYKIEGLQPNISYTISLSKDGYFGDAKELKTGNEKYSKEFSKNNGNDYDFSLVKINVKQEVEIPNIYYDFNSAILRDESKTELKKLVVMLTETPTVSVTINSHTDEQGADDYNLKLSEKRAQAVVDYLISEGINANRLTAKGFGESQPLIKNAQTDEEHQKNRRTTFKVTKK
ncbi:MAG: OmpA family protein, partial [Bacteroidia bacterium]|nr:OmpA family protein [Bacteroidia bacterium]